MRHRAGRPRAQRPVPRRRRRRQRCSTRPAGPTSPLAPEAAPIRWSAGSVTRLADGRYDVRFRLWDVVRGQDLGGQSYAGGRRRPAAGGAPHRRLHLREADRREGRLLDPHRLRHQGRQPLQPVGRRLPTARTRSRRWPAPSRSSRRPGRPTAGELAYVSFESRKPVVYVHDVATGKRRLIANFRGSNSAPAWSPDGRTLAVTLQPRRRLAALHDRRATAASRAA